MAPEYWTGTYVVAYDGTAGKIKVPQRLNMALDGTVKKPLKEKKPRKKGRKSTKRKRSRGEEAGPAPRPAQPSAE